MTEVSQARYILALVVVLVLVNTTLLGSIYTYYQLPAVVNGLVSILLLPAGLGYVALLAETKLLSQQKLGIYQPVAGCSLVLLVPAVLFFHVFQWSEYGVLSGQDVLVGTPQQFAQTDMSEVAYLELTTATVDRTKAFHRSWQTNGPSGQLSDRLTHHRYLFPVQQENQETRFFLHSNTPQPVTNWDHVEKEPLYARVMQDPYRIREAKKTFEAWQKKSQQTIAKPVFLVAQTQSFGELLAAKKMVFWLYVLLVNLLCLSISAFEFFKKSSARIQHQLQQHQQAAPLIDPKNPTSGA